MAANTAGKSFKAVILLGGPQQGTRFRPLSLKCPKPLFPIAGKPMIWHHIAACAKVPGMTEVVLLGMFPERDWADFTAMTERELGIPVRYLCEYTSLGTAGGIYHYRDFILRDNPDAFFVMHADVCTDFPLNDMIANHTAANCSSRCCTLMSVTARKDQAQSYGCIVADESDKVMHYVEKPTTFVSTNISCGIYLLTPPVFDYIRPVFLAHHSNGDAIDEIWFERDVIPQLSADGKCFVHKSDAFWSQVKTAGSAVYANRHYLATLRKTTPDLLSSNAVVTGDVTIHKTATVDDTAKIGPNVTIGPGVIVGPGVRVRDAIILDRVQLKDHCCILNSIVGWNTVVGSWARLEGNAVGVNPNDPSTVTPATPLFTPEGRLAPTITVVGEGCTVAKEVLVRHSIVLPHKEIKTSHQNEIIL